MKLVLMDSSHVAAVAALEKICFSMPWSEASVASELTNPLALWIVALDGDTLCGYVGSESVMGEADMMNIAVNPDYRRQGIARELVLELIRQLKKADVHCLTLEVRASNEPAIALYDSLGFIQVGRRPRYYLKPTEDALILRKEWEL